MTIKLKTVMGVLVAGGLVAGLASCDNRRGSDASGTGGMGGTSGTGGGTVEPNGGTGGTGGTGGQ